MLIGTFKALGYSKARITSKYLIYAIVASGVGAIIGIVALSKFLPWFMMRCLWIIYAVPCRPCPIDPAMTAAAAGLGVGITVIATWFAAASTLRERPAFLMLPRAPKAGKRILLERIRPVWRRLSFSWKVTSRDLFRCERGFVVAIDGASLAVQRFCLRAWGCRTPSTTSSTSSTASFITTTLLSAWPPILRMMRKAR